MQAGSHGPIIEKARNRHWFRHSRGHTLRDVFCEHLPWEAFVFGSPLKFLTRAFFHISFLKKTEKEVGEEKFINTSYTDYLYYPVGNYRLHKLIRFSATEGLIFDIRSKIYIHFLKFSPVA